MTWDELRGLKPVSADLETNIVAGRQRPPRKLKAALTPPAGWGGNRPTCRSRPGGGRWPRSTGSRRYPTGPTARLGALTLAAGADGGTGGGRSTGWWSVARVIPRRCPGWWLR